MNVLAFNAGSSSLKLAVFDVAGATEHELLRAERAVLEGTAGADHSAAARALIAALDPSLRTPAAIVHRLVHGGPELKAPARIDGAMRASLGGLVRFAPLHLPAELAVIDAAAAAMPGVPQVACFDTAFHASLPEVSRRLALPRALYDAGVRRYGFHGLSYEYLVESIGAKALGRAVLAHLGNGASMCAVRDGRSIDTTMGMTPAGGLVMSTRSGDLDPGVLAHVIEHLGLSARELGSLVNERSGLAGISGTTGDMKALLDASAKDERAALAVEAFCYAARKFVGAYAAILGGLDTLVFTGGIGERSAEVRARIARGLEFLGVRLDEGRNARGERVIGADGSACTLLVVPTDEQRMMARHAARVLLTSRAS